MQIPTILSGPIIRRVDPSNVYLWIATSKPLSIKAHLYTISKTSFKENLQYKLLSDHSVTRTIQVGKQVYVHLIKVTPSANERFFPTNTLLGYNLFFTSSKTIKDLGDFDLLRSTNPNRITYGKLKYPSFFISNSRKRAIFLYGSCRKTHGKGKDALISGDEHTERNHLLLSKRPSSLFLLGDQIYADDIPDPLMPLIKKLGNDLFGSAQQDRLSKVEPKLTKEPYKTKLDQLQGRQLISDELCKFTSSHAGNHLFRFSEFTAMYLLNWNPDLWSQAETLDLFQEQENQVTNNKFQEELASVQEFKKALPFVRRLLANTPTYMIFDDHDVTDDWNLSYEWKKKVRESPLGRHVVANGLATYWLFQGWGNNPDGFDEDFIETMAIYFRSPPIKSRKYEAWVKTLWEFDRWHFVSPTVPSVLFLDTRTQRAYDKRPEEGPRLLNQRAYERITELMNENRGKKHLPLLVASPAPVLGLNLIESFLKNYIYPLRTLGLPVHRMLDLETWIFNSRGYGELIHWLVKQKRKTTILLSGDAHYGFSIKSKVNHIKLLESNIYQFTSSPFKNESFPSLVSPIIESAVSVDARLVNDDGKKRYMDQQYRLHDDGDKVEQSDLLWKETLFDLPLDEDNTMMNIHNNIGLLEMDGMSLKNTLLD